MKTLKNDAGGAKALNRRMFPLFRYFDDSVWLLRAQTEPGWTAGKKALFWAWRIGLLLLGGAAVGYITLKFAFGAYPSEVFGTYLSSAPLLALNLLPAVWLVFALYAVFGRAWISFLLGGAATLALCLGNFFKLLFRDDPLYFEDLLIIREAGQMADDYAVFIDNRILLAAACLIAGTLALAIFARGAVRGWKSRLALLLVAAVSGAAILLVSFHKKLYDSLDNFEYLNEWNPTQNYIAHGFLYPFLHSAGEIVDIPPEGYSQRKARELLAAYSDADIPEDKKVNLITIMREAYVDLSKYGVEGLDVSGYDPYHSLRAESYSGTLFTNIFAGNTVDSERCFLTGNYELRTFRANTNSYLWYLRDQGYTVEGSHPYYQWFYNREDINSYLGFESYRFLENDYENLSGDFYVRDSVLFSEVYKDFVANKGSGRPYFSFNLTMQTHAPYYTDVSISPVEYLTGDYSRECKNAVDNYMFQIMDSDRQLMDLVEQLRAEEEPVVLVVFSDHLPWLGDSNAFYEELGIDIESGTEGAIRRRYETDYLIWANDAAKETLGCDFVGDGPTISPCYLMNLTFRLCGWEGPAFMQAMDEMMEVFPVVTTRDFYVVDDVFTEEIPKERRELFHQFEYLQRYWKNNFLY